MRFLHDSVMTFLSTYAVHVLFVNSVVMGFQSLSEALISSWLYSFIMLMTGDCLALRRILASSKNAFSTEWSAKVICDVFGLMLDHEISFHFPCFNSI